VDLNRIIVEQLDVLLHYRQQQGRIPIQIERRLGQNLGSIEALPHDLSRVVQNLLTNALEAVEERASQRDVTPTVPPYLPTVTIRTEAKNRCILMTVSDNGIGVPDTVLDRIFEPFVTTKPAGSGHTGLGLSLLHDTVVGRYGGTVLLLPSNEGATFRVELPSSAA
jgi:signal transduction histidine kinase